MACAHIGIHPCLHHLLPLQQFCQTWKTCLRAGPPRHGNHGTQAQRNKQAALRCFKSNSPINYTLFRKAYSALQCSQLKVRTLLIRISFRLGVGSSHIELLLILLLDLTSEYQAQLETSTILSNWYLPCRFGTLPDQKKAFRVAVCIASSIYVVRPLHSFRAAVPQWQRHRLSMNAIARDLYAETGQKDIKRHPSSELKKDRFRLQTTLFSATESRRLPLPPFPLTQTSQVTATLDTQIPTNTHRTVASIFVFWH